MKYMNKVQQDVYNFIKKNKEISQPEIAEYLFENGNYKNKNSVRATLCNILKILERDNLLLKRTEQNDQCGGIDKNMWRVK